MLVLLFIYQVFAVTDDSVKFNSTLNSTLKYGSFIQFVPNSFGMGSDNLYPIQGSAMINMTISSPTRSEFDLFVADSPYNQFYICYVYLSERNAPACRQLVLDLCKPCPKNSTYVRALISTFLQSVMSVQLNYQDSITYSNNLNTICFLGCEGLNLGSFIVANATYSDFQNAATYLLIDNSPFPDLQSCNVTFENCQDSTSTIVPNDSIYQNNSFCETVRNISCVQQFQNITQPELQLTIDFNVTVVPDNYPYYVQYMVMIILLIIIVFLFIILCVVAFRFKKVKKRKLQMIKKQK